MTMLLALALWLLLSVGATVLVAALCAGGRMSARY
jgi:hypothetical protein